MKKTILLFLLIVAFTLFSCQSGIDLKSDKHLAEVFTDNELKEIEKMISYVDDRVVEQTDNRDINEAYHQFLDEMDQSLNKLGLFEPFEDEEKFLFFESIDSIVFNDIWYIGNHLRYAKYKDSIYHNLDNYKYMGLRISGRYINYLEKIGKNDEYYKFVKEDIVMAGGISPSSVARFLWKHNEFDFTIPKNRLWAVVFILSIEESHDKKMERYIKSTQTDN